MKADVCDKDTAIETAGRLRSEAQQEFPSRQPPSSKADPADAMKKMEAAGTPGPAHRALAGLVGDWKAEVKCWCEPGGEAQVSQGRAKASLKFDGRFLEEDFHGEAMGRPFSGYTLMGYDNTKQSFTSVWISDTQTATFVSEGKGDNGYKVITLQGTSSCPVNGRMEVKSVLRVIGPDKHTFEMFDVTGGKNVKTMEITYTRA